MSELSGYLFGIPDRELRFQIAEIAYRNHTDPQAFDVFLACTMPLARQMAERKAYRIFGLPSDWQLECMYDGSVPALLAIFENHAHLSSLPNAFRRYLLRTLAVGALRDYFRREEHFGSRAVGDMTAVSYRQSMFRDPVDEDVLTRKVLEQVAANSFPIEDSAGDGEDVPAALEDERNFHAGVTALWLKLIAQAPGVAQRPLRAALHNSLHRSGDTVNSPRACRKMLGQIAFQQVV